MVGGRWIAAAVFAVLVAAVGACGKGADGDGGADEPPDTSVPEVPLPMSLGERDPATWPDCRAVWVTGQTLPTDYAGCVLSERYVGFDADPPGPTDAMLPAPSGVVCADGPPLVIGPFLDGHVITPTGSSVPPDAGYHYARPGETIHRTATSFRPDDPGFRAAVAVCRSSG